MRSSNDRKYRRALKSSALNGVSCTAPTGCVAVRGGRKLHPGRGLPRGLTAGDEQPPPDNQRGPQ